ncbi:hypothetical protein F4808DRAFT_462703 [Astrocystis sublimbata]|nr:hypothetical protein F4808DRAFT_462703 [Astrocystis sublimbata]
MFAPVVGLSWLLATASSHPVLQSPKQSSCPPFSSSTINIASYQLYPENVDFDQQSCLLRYYVMTSRERHKNVENTNCHLTSDIGSLYNASVVIYDPYEDTVVSTIELPDITRTKPFHIGGVARDPYNSANEITILVDAAQAHETAGQDVSGDNYLLRYAPDTASVLWSVNLTAVSQGRYGGPQDIEFDDAGNVYVLGTYPGHLFRVSGDGSSVDEWYINNSSTIAPPKGSCGGGDVLDTTAMGYTGLAAVDGTTLLVADSRNKSADGGALFRFDMGAEKGTPVPIPITYPGNQTADVIRPGDAIALLPKYDNEVLLITEHEGGVSVVQSANGKEWQSAKFLGRIANDPAVAADGGVVTAAVDIAGSVFLVEEWFTDPLVPGTSAGNRTLFPLVDITAQLDALVMA